MTEQATPHEGELNPEWQETMREGITDSLDNFDMLFYPDPDDPEGVETPLNFSPAAFSSGEDERMFRELDPAEQAFVIGEFFSQLGFDPDHAEPTDGYTISAPAGASWQGEADVVVYQTARSDEGLSLHEMSQPDGNREYFIAPQDYRL